MKRTLIVLGAVMLLATTAWAQAPQTFLYQGRLTDAEGAPLVPPVALTFTLWSAESGGTQIWTSGEMTLDAAALDAQGLFAVELGPFGGANFDGAQRWLQIQVTGEDPMAPRQLITSVPYAMSAMTAQSVPNNSISTSQILNDSVQDVDLADEPGAARAFTGNSATIPATPGSMLAATITIPTSGYVIANASAMVALNHTNGSASRISVSIGTNPSAVAADSRTLSVVNYSQPTNLYFLDVSTQSVLTFGSAGTYTIHLVADQESNTGHVMYYPKLVLTFVPTTYGPLAKAESADASIGPADGPQPGDPR